MPKILILAPVIDPNGFFMADSENSGENCKRYKLEDAIKITVSETPPDSPSVGDLWVDTSA